MFQKCMVSVLVIGWSALLFASPTVFLNGVVKTKNRRAVPDAVVSLANRPYLKATTDAHGRFTIRSRYFGKAEAAPLQESLEIDHAGKGMRLSVTSPVTKGTIEFFAGNGQKVADIPIKDLESGIHSVPFPSLSPGMYIMHVTIGDMVTRCKVIASGREFNLASLDIQDHDRILLSANSRCHRTIDTLIVEKPGFATSYVPIRSYRKYGIVVVLNREDTDTSYRDIVLPKASSLSYENPKMPNPFTFKFMNLPAVTTKALWEYRRQEIMAMAQEYLYGHLPPKPDSVWGTVTGTSITVQCQQGDRQSTFSVNVNGTGNILAIDLAAGAPQPDNSRRCQLNPTNILRIIDSLYDSTDIGLCMATTWGVGRIIDVLEQHPESGIDADKVMITGCSTFGKQALIAGIFEPRIALCVPVESGCCGSCAWRVSSEYGHGNSDTDCQDITRLEMQWLGTVAEPFRNGSVNISRLPFDQHEVMALRAPRPMLVFNNSPAWSWLCPKGNVAAAQGCHWIYKALGAADNFGFAESAAEHMHCQFPSEHAPDIAAFYDKVFNGNPNANTSIMRWSKESEETAKWFDWDTTVTLQ